MKSSGLLMSVLGSSLLLGGAMFTAPRITHNAGLWYLAGQARIALGDTTGGLKLMSRAAQERRAAQAVQTPAAKPTPAVARKSCGQSSVVQPAPRVTNAKAKQVRTVKPLAKAKMILASVNFPPDPFAGRTDVPGMSAEDVARVTAEYKREVRRWMDSKRQHRVELAQLKKANLRMSPGKAHAPDVRVVIGDPGRFSFDSTPVVMPAPQAIP